MQQILTISNSCINAGQVLVHRRHLFITLAIFFGISQVLFSQPTYTFTSAGATGRFGPTQSQVNSAYASTNLNGLVTVTTQGVQEWTVSSTGLYRIQAVGAKGGNGLGASITGDFTLTAGTVLKIIVGQPGFLGSGSSGGGGSFVVKKTTTTPVVADILVIAGGGGGTGSGLVGTLSGGSDLQSGTNNGSGGNNQGCIGGGGGFLTNGNINFAGNDNGAHGKSFINNGAGGAGVSGVNGGFGGGAGMTCGPAGWNAGGGGYSGGSGGGGSGGGGSSYNAGTNQSNTAGVNSGSGLVTIAQLFTTDISQTAGILCNGLSTAALSATVSGGAPPYTHTWLPSGGNGTTASGLTAGVYTFSSTDVNGLSFSTTFTVTEPAVLASGISSQTNVTCFGGNNGALVVAPTGGTAPYTYTWSPSGGNAAATTGLTAGTYTCTIKDANNCNTIQQTATVTQPSTFAVSASASSPTICNGASTTLNGSGAATYTWTGGITDGLPFSPTVTASYSVSGTNSFGCLSSNVAVVTVTVHSLPVIIVNSGAICAGQTFTMVPGGANTYTFSSGGNTVSPSANSSYSVTGTSSEGCLSSNTAISSVTVNALPVISVNSGTICSGKSFTMIPGGANTYTYTGGSAIVSPTTTTAYSVTGTSMEGCVSASPAVSSVTVIALPVISVNSGSICAGQSFTMSPSGASTYTFSNGNAVVTPGATTSYSVTGTSSLGCISSNTAVSSVTVNALPVITINSGTICTGQTFTMVPGGANTYTFSNGSNIVSPSSNSSYSVTGTSVAGCISAGAAVNTVIVNALPVISVNSGTICSGQSFTMVASGANTYTYTGGSAIVSPMATSAYSVTGTSTAGCVSASAAVSNVTVIALPVISVNNGTICSGQSFTLVASGANSYTFSGGTPIVSPTVPTSYSVTGTSSLGCEGTAAISTITVYALPWIIVNSGPICFGQSFTIAPNGASTYTYSGGSSVVSPTVTESYSVTGTSIEGCVSPSVAVSTVTVNALPAIVINGSTAICSGNSATWSASGASTYTWTTSDVSSSVVVSPSITSTYTVTGTDLNGCGSSASQTLLVNALPFITVSNSNSVMCIGESNSLTASGGLTYSWTTGQTDPIIAITPTTSASYTVTGYDANGCMNSAVATQSVSECTGISSAKGTHKTFVSVYPNPNNGEFTITCDTDIQISIINEIGQVVKTELLNESNSRNIAVSDLANGIYFVLGKNNDQVITQKIIVNK